MRSGLYEKLVADGLLIPHKESNQEIRDRDDEYKVIEPETIPFISYPYEWCFSQLKAAALATLRVQETALKFGMILKDASAYNIQFRDNEPVLIDTLSFEKYEEGKPWIAYRQFCQHFLAPLALMSYRDIRFGKLARLYIDGIPLDLASGLLPRRSYFRFSLLTHIHMHAKSQIKYAGSGKAGRGQISRHSLNALVANLYASVERLRWRIPGSEWSDYYGVTNYTPEAMQLKGKMAAEFIDSVHPRIVWDLGANTGFFSRIASAKGALTISFDYDPSCVELNYIESRDKKQKCLLPLIMDLANPSPGLGWAHEERMSLARRGPSELILALALVHHLAISNNLPLVEIARYLSDNCGWLIIEFVPKSDSQVKRLLATREDIFPEYTRDNFEREFSRKFEILKSEPIPESERWLYLMRVREK